MTDIVKFLKETYGDCRRNGLDKLAVSHTADVAGLARVDDLNDAARRRVITRVCLLHDVVEEKKCTLEDLVARFDLSEEEQHLLDLLNRGEYSEGCYWRRIFRSADALRVKLADRVANLKDLIAWIRSDGYLTCKSGGQSAKYLREDSLVRELFEEMPPAYRTKEEDRAAIRCLKSQMDELVDELRILCCRYDMQS